MRFLMIKLIFRTLIFADLRIHDGEYQYGDNYKPREMSLTKKISYALIRIIIIPFRRSL